MQKLVREARKIIEGSYGDGSKSNLKTCVAAASVSKRQCDKEVGGDHGLSVPLCYEVSGGKKQLSEGDDLHCKKQLSQMIVIRWNTVKHFRILST